MSAARSIDWSKLGWCMTQNVQVGSTACAMFANGGARYAQFKGESDAVMSAYNAAQKRPTSIDFEAYKKALPAQAAWVADMEAKYNATNIPRPVDTLSESIAADDSKVASAVSEAQKALDVAAADAVKELAALKGLAPAAQLTHADIYRAFPELNPFSPAEMENYYWDPQYTRNVDLLLSEMRGDNVDGDRLAEDTANFSAKAMEINNDMSLDYYGNKKE